MKKSAALGAIVAAVLTASCSGGHSAGTLPAAGTTPGTSGSAPTSIGARTARAASAAVTPAGWAATGTGAIALANASDLGQLDRAKNVDVVLALQMGHVDAVKSA